MVSIWSKISSHESFDQKELAYLDEQVKLYPHVSVFQAMLAKHHVNSESGQAETLVKHAALRVQSRAKLHNYLYAEGINNDKVDFSHTIVSSKDEDEMIPELNEQLIASALGSGLAIDLISDDPAENKSNDQHEESRTTAKEVIVSPESDHKRDIPQTQPIIEEPSEMSFVSWMSHLADNPISDGKEGFDQTKASKLSKEVSTSIVDHFLENEEEIVPKRAEFYSPSKAAKASLEDNNNLVTQTLAEVYAAQGNIDKAISTYEKLSLLNPEKSAYFAALIQKLNKDK